MREAVTSFVSAVVAVPTAQGGWEEAVRGLPGGDRIVHSGPRWRFLTVRSKADKTAIVGSKVRMAAGGS